MSAPPDLVALADSIRDQVERLAVGINAADGLDAHTFGRLYLALAGIIGGYDLAGVRGVADALYAKNPYRTREERAEAGNALLRAIGLGLITARAGLTDGAAALGRARLPDTPPAAARRAPGDGCA